MTDRPNLLRTAALSLGALLALSLLATLPAAGQERPPTPPPRASESRLFHVALVLAERDSNGGGNEPLPAAVQKALDDIRDFLPYKRYRVADSALVRSDGSSAVVLETPDGVSYRADFLFSEGQVDGEAILDISHFSLMREDREWPTPPGPHTERGLAVAPRASEPSISASFRMKVGETVVVGSSRLESDGSTGRRALIVLVTAVP